MQVKICTIAATGCFLLVNELTGREIYIVITITEIVLFGLVVSVVVEGDNSQMGKSLSGKVNQ